MTAIISHYLDAIRDSLRLDSSSKAEILSELETHIEDELQELRQKGLSEEEAAGVCLRLLGSAKTVARQIYEAHSQGTWRHAFYASLPHFLFFLLFALNWWGAVALLVVVVSIIAIVTLYGWWHGRPSWFLPWLGYFMLPVLASGPILLFVPVRFGWIALIVYVPLAFWMLSRAIRHKMREDWIYCSLMLFPLPVVIGWFFAVQYEGRLSAYSVARLQFFAPWIGLSFLALAVAVGTFVRLRKRWLKIATLPITGTATLIVVACYAWDRLEMPVFIVLIVLSLGIFIVPALLESRPLFPENHPLSRPSLFPKVFKRNKAND